MPKLVKGNRPARPPALPKSPRAGEGLVRVVGTPGAPAFEPVPAGHPLSVELAAAINEQLQQADRAVLEAALQHTVERGCVIVVRATAVGGRFDPIQLASVLRLFGQLHAPPPPGVKRKPIPVITEGEVELRVGASSGKSEDVNPSQEPRPRPKQSTPAETDQDASHVFKPPSIRTPRVDALAELREQMKLARATTGMGLEQLGRRMLELLGTPVEDITPRRAANKASWLLNSSPNPTWDELWAFSQATGCKLSLQSVHPGVPTPPRAADTASPDLGEPGLNQLVGLAESSSVQERVWAAERLAEVPPVAWPRAEAALASLLLDPSKKVVEAAWNALQGRAKTDADLAVKLSLLVSVLHALRSGTYDLTPESLRGRMLTAVQLSGLSRAEVGRRIRRPLKNPSQEVHKLLTVTDNPGIFTLHDFAQAANLQGVRELLDLEPQPIP